MHRVPAQTLALLGVCLIPACTLALDFSDPIGSEPDSGPFVDQDAAQEDAPSANDTCGDGTIQPTEECDDTNKGDRDGCSADCIVEAGYTCTSEPSTCAAQGICPAATIVSSGTILDSCKSYYDAGYRVSGKYRIDPDGPALREGFDAICDMDTAGGGWTIVVNNAADAIEPDGCLPRLATVDAFACGVASCSEDFAVPVYGMPFTELAWVAHDGSFALGPHNLFSWATSRTLPNIANWTLNAGQSGLKLAGLEAQALIECQSAILPNGLRRVGNENVRVTTGGFAVTDVVTIFDIDTDVGTPGNMSFTDTASVGLDDFQDGGGCSDMWAPLASRGSATLIMIR